MHLCHEMNEEMYFVYLILIKRAKVRCDNLFLKGIHDNIENEINGSRTD